MTAPQRPWVPDDNLVEHARLGGVNGRLLCNEDRAWVVAGLTAAGLTGEETAKCLGLSLRVIRQVRAEPMTRIAVYALRMRQMVIAEVCAAKKAARDHELELACKRRELNRLELQRNRLIDSLAAARGKPLPKERRPHDRNTVAASA